MEDKIVLNYHVEGNDLAQAGEASSKMKMALRRLGLSPDLIRRAAICMYEGEINMVIHADGGDVTVEVGLNEIIITMKDTGPGIANVEQAMEEGYTTADDVARDLGFGAGMGLPNMKRYSDEMTVESTVGAGTTVRMTIRMEES